MRQHAPTDRPAGRRFTWCSMPAGRTRTTDPLASARTLQSPQQCSLAGWSSRRLGRRSTPTAVSFIQRRHQRRQRAHRAFLGFAAGASTPSVLERVSPFVTFVSPIKFVKKLDSNIYLTILILHHKYYYIFLYIYSKLFLEKRKRHTFGTEEVKQKGKTFFFKNENGKTLTLFCLFSSEHTVHRANRAGEITTFALHLRPHLPSLCDGRPARWRAYGIQRTNQQGNKYLSASTSTMFVVKKTSTMLN